MDVIGLVVGTLGVLIVALVTDQDSNRVIIYRQALRTRTQPGFGVVAMSALSW